MKKMVVICAILMSGCAHDRYVPVMPHIERSLLVKCNDVQYSGGNKLSVVVEEIIANNHEHKLCKLRLDGLIDYINHAESVYANNK